MHVLTQIFALCPNVDYLHIFNFDDHPGRHDYFDRTEWLAVFRLFPTVKTLHVYGSLAEQVSHALEDVPAEMITDILLCLHSLIVGDPGLASATRFVSLRQLRGRPVRLMGFDTCSRSQGYTYTSARPALCMLQKIQFHT